MYPRVEEYPKRLRIRGKWWRVKFSDQPIIYGGTECRGISCPDERLITIDPDFSLPIIMRTLVHEIFHAFEFEYKIKIPHALIYALERPVTSFVYLNFFKGRRGI